MQHLMRLEQQMQEKLQQEIALIRVEATAGGGMVTVTASGTGEIRYPIADFYLTNAICRASPTMHRCSEELLHGDSFAVAA